MIRKARPSAATTPLSSSVTGPKNISASVGCTVTITVSTSASAAEAHSHLFCFFMVNSDARRLRMLKQWKISTMLSVMKAIITPSSSALPAIISEMWM